MPRPQSLPAAAAETLFPHLTTTQPDNQMHYDFVVLAKEGAFFTFDLRYCKIQLVPLQQFQIVNKFYYSPRGYLNQLPTSNRVLKVSVNQPRSSAFSLYPDR